MFHKTNYLLEWGLLLAIFSCSAFLTEELLVSNFTLYNGNVAVMKLNVYRDSDGKKGTADSGTGLVSGSVSGSVSGEAVASGREQGNSVKSVPDFSTIHVAGMDFLISSDKKAFEYGMISKSMEGGITYLYSHNSYRRSENSGKKIYQNLSLGDRVEFDGKWSYKVVRTGIIDFTDGTPKIPDLLGETSVIYFTCTPYGDNVRKYFELAKSQ